MEGINAEEVERFLEGSGLAAGSATCARNYRDILGQLDRFLRGKPFRQVTEENLRRFMRTRKVKPRSQNHHIRARIELDSYSVSTQCFCLPHR